MRPRAHEHLEAFAVREVQERSDIFSRIDLAKVELATLDLMHAPGDVGSDRAQAEASEATPNFRNTRRDRRLVMPELYYQPRMAQSTSHGMCCRSSTLIRN